MQSDKGFPYSKLILTIGLVMSLFFSVVAILNLSPTEADAPDWSFFLIFAGMVLIISVVGSIILPNTLTVRLIDNQIEVSKGNRKELISISNIKRITASTSFLNQGFNRHEFYKIELKQDSNFGQTIFYKVNSRYNSELTAALKSSLAKTNAH